MIVIGGTRGMVAVSLNEAVKLTGCHDDVTGSEIEDQAYIAYRMECERFGRIHMLVGEVLSTSCVDDYKYFSGGTCFRAHHALPSLATADYDGRGEHALGG